MVEEYLSYPEGSEERIRLEMKKGKGNLERLVAKFREDEENKNWLQERTRACAGCGVRVEKRFVRLMSRVRRVLTCVQSWL